MDLQLFASTFALIFVAELPDKTAFATLLLATKSNSWSVFVGVCAAFVVQSLVAVAFGSVLTYFPEKWVHLISGLLFFIFAFLALRRPQAQEEKSASAERNDEAAFSWRVVWTSFVVIFIAEWGDLTQLATASLQARYRSPVTIFLGSTLALWGVTGIAIIVGNRAKKVAHPLVLNRIAAAAFTLVGIYLVYPILRDW